MEQLVKGMEHICMLQCAGKKPAEAETCFEPAAVCSSGKALSTRADSRPSSNIAEISFSPDKTTKIDLCCLVLRAMYAFTAIQPIAVAVELHLADRAKRSLGP